MSSDLEMYGLSVYEMCWLPSASVSHLTKKLFPVDVGPISRSGWCRRYAEAIA